jgi:hypothetical protein
MRRFICPVEGCGREAKYEAAIGEEVVIPNGAVLTRGPWPERVQRNFWVRCPVHGRRWLLERGNHVSGKLPPAK